MAKKSDSNKPVLTDAEKKAAKKAAFVKLCKPRVDKTLKAMHQVEQLASQNYIRTVEQEKAVIAALRQGVDRVDAAFQGTLKDVGGFQLPQ